MNVVFDNQIYAQGNQIRCEATFAIRDPACWSGCRVLEVGAGIGHMGSEFAALGADVASSDARRDNVAEGKTRYPSRVWFALDLDDPNATLAARYDVVICFGVLYHLRDPAAALSRLSKYAREAFISTVVVDSSDPHLCYNVKEGPGRDQHLTGGVGSRFSYGWIERELRQHYSRVVDITPHDRPGAWATRCKWLQTGDQSGACRNGSSWFRKMYWGYQ